MNFFWEHRQAKWRLPYNFEKFPSDPTHLRPSHAPRPFHSHNTNPEECASPPLGMRTGYYCYYPLIGFYYVNLAEQWAQGVAMTTRNNLLKTKE